ncbi:hypothetical protein D3C80_2025480 [compost metagenome]
MDMIDLADLVVICAINCCTFQNRRGQFGFNEAYVIGMIHFSSSCLGCDMETPAVQNRSIASGGFWAKPVV